jgi:hypothetical protein
MPDTITDADRARAEEAVGPYWDKRVVQFWYGEHYCNREALVSTIAILIAETERATIERCACVADEWRVSGLANGDLTDEQLHDFLNDIGPNIAAAIRALGKEG